MADDELPPMRGHWGEDMKDDKRDAMKKIQQARSVRAAELAPSTLGSGMRNGGGVEGGGDAEGGDAGSSRRPLERPTNVVRNRRLKKLDQLLREGDFFSRAAMEERAPLLYYEHAGRFEEEDGRCAEDSEFRAGAASWSVSCGPEGMDEEDEGEGMGHAAPRPSGRGGGAAGHGGGGEARADQGQEGRGQSEGGPPSAERGRDEGKSLRAGGLGETMSKFLLEASDRSDFRKERDRQRDQEVEQEEESDEESAEGGDTEMDGVGSKEEMEAREAERDKLWDEFCKHMAERFLQGLDFEHFDYGTCDEDADLDDLEQMARDAEDDYFSSEGGGSDAAHLSRAQAQSRFMKASRVSASDGDYDY